MTTFTYKTKLLHLYCHIGRKDWNPLENIDDGVLVTVARHPFPVEETTMDGDVMHHIVHRSKDYDPTTKLSGQSIVLFVGSGPFPESKPHSENPPRFYMRDRCAFEQVDKWLLEFLDLDLEKAKTLARCKNRTEAQEFEECFENFLDVILPGRIENQLAYRLLREAQSICKGKESATFNDTGIVIHAATDIKQWLAVFDTDEAIAFRTLARCIVDDETANGRTAPENIKKGLSAKTASDLNSLKDAIEKFHKEAIKPTV